MVERCELGPRALGASFVVGLAAFDAPSVVVACVDLNPGGHFRGGEGRFEGVLGCRLALVVVVGYGAVDGCLHLGDEEVWAVRLIRYEAASVEGGCRTDAVGDDGCSAEGERTAHAVSLHANLVLLVGLRLLVDKGDVIFGVTEGCVLS